MTNTDVGARTILTIGHGGRSVEDLLDLLEQHRRRFVIDVRSSPYSRYAPEFSKAPLQRRLQEAGFVYVFMGDTLGGRPEDPAAYDAEGHVDYHALQTLPFFQEGLTRLIRASNEAHAVILLCSELLPERCHRSKLIGEALSARDVPVQHLGRDGVLLDHADVMRVLEGDQLSLLPDDSHKRSRISYRE